MEYTPIGDVVDLADLAQQVDYRLGEMAEHFEADHIGIVVPRENMESGKPARLTVQEVLLPLMGQATPTSSAKLIDAEAVLGGTQWVDLTDKGETDLHIHDARYYTETESDARFVNVTGDTMTGALYWSAAGANPYITNAGSRLELYAGGGLDYLWLDPSALTAYFRSSIGVTSPTQTYTATTGLYFKTASAGTKLVSRFYRSSTGDGLTLTAVAAADDGFLGTVQGDVAFKVGSAGTLHFGAWGTPQVAELKIADGAVTVTGTLAVTGTLGVGGNVTIGAGAAGVDYSLTFNGEDTDGVLTWLEDEDRFQFLDNICMDDGKGICFRLATERIYSGASGYMDYLATTTHRFTGDVGVERLYLADDASGTTYNLSIWERAIGAPRAMVTGTTASSFGMIVTPLGTTARNTSLQFWDRDLDSAANGMYGGFSILGATTSQLQIWTAGQGALSGQDIWFAPNLSERLRLLAAGGSQFTGDVTWLTTGKALFRDTGLHISSPANGIMALVADGCITLGAIATNYTAFEADGTRVAYGAATTFNDIYLPFEGAHVPAANNPTWTAWLGNVSAYTFAVNDYLDLQTTELMHTYLEDSDFEFHVHFCTNGLEAAAKYVKWEIEYSIANSATSGAVGDTFPATTVITAETEIPASTPDRKNMYTTIAPVTGTNFKVGAIMKVKVRRIASAGAAPLANPFGLMVGIHVEQDTDGSRTQRAK